MKNKRRALLLLPAVLLAAGIGTYFFLSAGSTEASLSTQATEVMFSSFSSSSSSKEEQRMTQLQSRLEEAIVQIEGISSCSVSLSPENSCSLKLQLEDGKNLTPEEEGAIQNLVSASLKDVPPEAVSLSW